MTQCDLCLRAGKEPPRARVLSVSKAHMIGAYADERKATTAADSASISTLLLLTELYEAIAIEFCGIGIHG